MILHHLHRRHILMRDVVGGKSVLTSDEIVAVDIELVYRLPLILYCAVFFHLDARQPFDNIDNGIILRVGIFSDIEYQRIPFGIYIRSFDYHIVQLRDFRSHTHT